MILTSDPHRKLPGRCAARHFAASSDDLTNGADADARASWIAVAALRVFLQQRLPGMPVAAKTNLTADKEMPAISG